MLGAPVDTTGDSVNRIVEAQQLRRDLAELRNAVEIQRHELEQLRHRQRRLYDDIDTRLRRYEETGGCRPRC